MSPRARTALAVAVAAVTGGILFVIERTPTGPDAAPTVAVPGAAHTPVAAILEQSEARPQPVRTRTDGVGAVRLQVLDPARHGIAGATAFRVEDPAARWHREVAATERSDGQGWFVLPLAGDEPLRGWMVAADGFCQAHAGDLAVPADATTWRLTLQPAATARVRLVDLRGQPATGVHVQLSGAGLGAVEAPSDARPGTALDAIHTAKTGLDGTVRFVGLCPGRRYFVTVADPGVAISPLSTAELTPQLDKDAEQSLVVAPILCCAFEADSGASLAITAAADDLGEGAFASTLLRTKMDLRQRFPNASLWVDVARSHASRFGVGAHVTCRSEGTVAWEGRHQLLPATQLEAPTRIAFSAPPDRDGRAVLRVSDESGQQLEGLWATIVQDGNETPGGRRTMEVGSELALPPGKWRIDDLRPATPTDARGFGEFLVTAGTLVEPSVRVRGAFREVRLEVKMPDGSAPRYAIIGLESAGYSSTLRSMRPADVPLWLPLGVCRFRVTVIGYQPVLEEVEIQHGRPGSDRQHFVVQVRQPTELSTGR